MTTDQGDRLRTAFETMRDFVSEAKFVFNSSGLDLIGQDYANVVLVRYSITAALLKETGGSYVYDSPVPIVVGVKPKVISSCLKCSAPGDTISLEITPSAPNRIVYRCFNSSKNSRWEIITPELVEQPPPQTFADDMSFSGSITMSSNSYYDMIRDLATTESPEVSVKCDLNKLVLSANGFMSKVSFEISADAVFVRRDKNPASWPICATFALVFLQRVAKAKNICPQIVIRLKNDYPISLSYESPIGILQYVIAPRDEQDSNDPVISKKRRIE